MYIPCPHCGPRDRREFYYKGHAAFLERPDPEDDPEGDAWADYVHLRENPAGETRDLWLHDGGCGAWLVVTRNTVTHEVLGAELVSGRSSA